MKIKQIDDIDIENVSNGNILVYDVEAGKFKNSDSVSSNADGNTVVKRSDSGVIYIETPERGSTEKSKKQGVNIDFLDRQNYLSASTLATNLIATSDDIRAELRTDSSDQKEKIYLYFSKIFSASNPISITDMNGYKIFSIKLRENSGLSVDVNGLYSDLRIVAEATPETGYQSTYRLKDSDGNIFGDPINIPLDKFIESAESGIATDEDVQPGGRFGPGTDYYEVINVGDAFICLTVYQGEIELKKVYTKIEIPNINENTFVFSKDLITTEPIGKIRPEAEGYSVIPSQGKTFSEVWDLIFKKIEDPTITKNPSVSLSLSNNSAKEVGTTVDITATASYTPGKYSFNTPDETPDATPTITYNGTSYSSISQLIPSVKITESKQAVTVSWGYSEAANYAKNNLGEVTDLKLEAGTATNSAYISAGYYKVFIGYTNATSANDLTSSDIRGCESTGGTIFKESECTGQKSTTEYSGSTNYSAFFVAYRKAKDVNNKDFIKDIKVSSTNESWLDRMKVNSVEMNVKDASGVDDVEYKVLYYKPIQYASSCTQFNIIFN